MRREEEAADLPWSDLTPWPHRNPAKGPHQLPTGAPPARLHRDRQDTPAQQPAESPPARPAYPAAPRPCRETATSPTVTGTLLSQRDRTLHCRPARGPQRRLDTPTLTRENQPVPAVFCKNKSQILHPKCKILQPEKSNFAKILQCFYTA